MAINEILRQLTNSFDEQRIDEIEQLRETVLNGPAFDDETRKTVSALCFSMIETLDKIRCGEFD